MEIKKPTKQKMRFNDSEMNLLKATFADNEELLKVIRKVVLQMPLNAVDMSMIEVSIKGKPELLKLIRKCFIPELEPDAPINQEIDLWMTVSIIDKNPLDAMNHLAARETLINYLEQQMNVLAGVGGETINFKELSNINGKSCEEVFSDMVARNTIVQHTEQQLMFILTLAGKKEESVEETQKRLAQNSNK